MLSPDNTIDFVPIVPEHLKGALRLSRAAGWPHRLEDWQMALALSEGVAALDANGSVIGTVLVTPYGTEAATINMVIVDEALRGRGVGRQLMAAALTHGGTRPLRLVATTEGLPLYEKLGFRATGAVLQHQGIAGALDSPRTTEPASVADLAVIAATDQAAFGADRRTLIEAIADRGTFAVIRRAGRIDGFSALRPFGRGAVIGPVVACTPDDAKDLVAHFIASHPGQFLRVDTTADAGLDGWLVEQGLAHVGGGIAMRRHATGPATGIDTEPNPRSGLSTYALASQALG